MKDIIALAKRRWQWALLIAILLLVAVVVALVAGAQIWHALMGLLGVGGAAAPSLKKYARADTVRINQQAEIDEWRKQHLANQEKLRQQQEDAAKKAHEDKLNDIQDATTKESPEQLRKRLLDQARRND